MTRGDVPQYVRLWFRGDLAPLDLHIDEWDSIRARLLAGAAGWYTCKSPVGLDICVSVADITSIHRFGPGDFERSGAWGRRMQAAGKEHYPADDDDDGESWK